MSGEFCDTNVLVYAYDSSAGTKQEQAAQLLRRLWESEVGVVSIQVLQELFVSLTQKISQPLPHQRARQVVADMTTWRVMEPKRRDVVDAMDAARRWQVSFWDAMILTAARKMGAAILWSEDLNDGRDYDGTVVRNPFLR
jgi:predicted nucleic acid-binding protein